MKTLVKTKLRDAGAGAFRRPYDNLSFGDRFGRGILYTLLMIYLFIGVSIVSDRFMESIEMITAQEKEVTIKDPKSGRNQVL